MAEFKVGQTFLDKAATNYFGSKGKYYIALSSAEYDDDDIICFVMNTEKDVKDYALGCNKKSQKYIIAQNTFSFIKWQTAIMLENPVRYKLSEMYEENIKILDLADEKMCRQIKNCINKDYIPGKFLKLINASFN